MKHLLMFLVFGVALSLCGLTSKLREATKSSNENSNSATSSDSGGAAVEHPQPTAAQVAVLEGGQEISWDQQGMSWKVPANWTELERDSQSFLWHSPGSGDSASLNVSISTMDESFPTEISLQAFYDGAKTRAKNGEVDELKWIELDGLKGVLFRESNPEKADGFRRLQWLAYRKYAGQVQMVNLMLATNGRGFPKHQDAMYGILYSTKIVH